MALCRSAPGITSAAPQSAAGGEIGALGGSGVLRYCEGRWRASYVGRLSPLANGQVLYVMHGASPLRNGTGLSD